METPKWSYPENKQQLFLHDLWVAVLAPAWLQQTAQAMKALHIREHPGDSSKHTHTQIESKNKANKYTWKWNEESWSFRHDQLERADCTTCFLRFIMFLLPFFDWRALCCNAVSHLWFTVTSDMFPHVSLRTWPSTAIGDFEPTIRGDLAARDVITCDVFSVYRTSSQLSTWAICFLKCALYFMWSAKFYRLDLVKCDLEVSINGWYPRMDCL